VRRGGGFITDDAALRRDGALYRSLSRLPGHRDSITKRKEVRGGFIKAMLQLLQ